MQKKQKENNTQTRSYFGDSNPALTDKTTAKIFSYLDTNTLAGTASLVSKEWKRLVDTEFEDPIYLAKLYKTKLENVPPFKNDTHRNIISSKKLVGGLTNTTLFFKADTGDFVARRPGKNSEYFINRASEAYNAKIASDQDINAKVIFSEENGTQVTEYLANPCPMNIESFRDPANIKKAIDTLKSIHQCGKRFANDINVFTRNKTMHDILKSHGENLSIDYINTAIKMDDIEAIFKSRHIQTVPCHNDTTTSNFILSNGQMKIIDWEYSGNNDPIWDLACLSMEGEFTNDQDLRMFNAYFGSCDNDEYKLFILYKPVVEYWVGLWCLVQISNQNFSDTPDILKQMEQQRFQNCLCILNGDEFNDAFNSLKNNNTAAIPRNF